MLSFCCAYHIRTQQDKTVEYQVECIQSIYIHRSQMISRCGINCALNWLALGFTIVLYCMCLCIYIKYCVCVFTSNHLIDQRDWMENNVVVVDT